MHDVLAGLILPSRARPLHADREERLACRLDVAAADRQPVVASRRVLHLVAVVLDVCDRLVNRLGSADPNILPIAAAELAQDGDRRAIAVEQPQLPALAMMRCVLL